MGKKRVIWASVLGGLAVGVLLMMGVNIADTYTSTNDSCMSCHYHEEADQLWKQSSHHLNGSGTVTNCAACHLPPKEEGLNRYYMIKFKMGAKDLWAKAVKDQDDIDWAAKRQVDYAPHIVYNASCVKCHEDLYPEGISDDGVSAHLYYDENAEKLGLNCVSCHLNAGHYIEGYTHQKLQGTVDTGPGEIYEAPAAVDHFESFTETVPGTNAAIRMIAVPGGEFLLGSPANEPRRHADERYAGEHLPGTPQGTLWRRLPPARHQAPAPAARSYAGSGTLGQREEPAGRQPALHAADPRGGDALQQGAHRC